MAENYLTAFWRSLTKGTAVAGAEELNLALTNLSRKYTDLEGRYDQLVADHQEATEKLVVFRDELVKIVDNFKHMENELWKLIDQTRESINLALEDMGNEYGKSAVSILKLALQEIERQRHG